MAKFPIDFQDKLKSPSAADGDGYPYSISASDLMENFAHAFIDVESDWVSQISVGQHASRKLKLPRLPASDKTYVLGATNGIISWIETQKCEETTSGE